MSRPHLNPTLDGAIQRAATLYRESRPLLEPSNLIVFVCGGASVESRSGQPFRQRFLQRAIKNAPDTLWLLAESAAHKLSESGSPRFVNMAYFEDTIAGISDAIVVFSESPGSIAELGYFCAKENILAKLLVIRKREHENVDSFINLGLVDLINSTSLYRPAISINGMGKKEFDDIVSRINRHVISHFRRKPFPRTRFVEMDLKCKFIFVQFVIYLLGKVTYGGVIAAIRAFCGDNKGIEIDNILSVLSSAEIVRRHADDPNQFTYTSERKPFIIFTGTQMDKMRVAITDSSQKRGRHAY